MSDEILTPDEYGDYYHAGTTEKAGIWSGITEELAKDDPAIAELPSTREAFQRYLKLGAATTADIDGESGLDISPNPNAVTARGAPNWFFSQELAFLAQTSAVMPDISEQARRRGFPFDVAPLVVYNRYAEPSEPTNDTVVAKGKQAGHSNAIAAVVRNGTKKKEKAVAFVKWVASPAGQLVRAKLGFFPSQKSLIDDVVFNKGVAPQNVTVFSEALEYQRPGDWWYMPDHVWVEKWCVDLNADVRNGKMTYKQWIDGTGPTSIDGEKVVVRTNEYLKRYKKYSR